MLEKIFQTIMSRYFGQFITGLENVQLTFWSGKINLHNISLKHQKINQLLKSNNIPFSIKYSHIGSLSLDIPWKSLSSTPVEVKIQDVFIVLKMQKITSVSKKIQEEKLSLVKNYLQHLIKKAVEVQKVTGQNQDGYLKKMVMKIVHNLNADIKNISIRFVSDQSKFNRKIGNNEEQLVLQKNSSVGSSSLRPKTQFPYNSQNVSDSKRNYETNSQRLDRQKQKSSFAFGFCVQSFNLQTVDENFNRTFYNSDNKKSLVRKIITMRQISAYLQEYTTFNLFKVSEQKKNQFMTGIILREKFRLLSIDGRIIMNKNIQKNVFYDYLFTMHLQLLEVKSTYGQLKQITKIIANFQAAAGARQIKKLTQLEQVKQLQLKQQFIDYFPTAYQKKFDGSVIDQNFAKLLCSVSKKNLLSWTKQCAIQIIKQTKLQSMRKQKNKKGWLSYIISQAQVDLTQGEINQIYQEVEELVKSIDYEKKLSIKVELIFDKIAFLLSHEQLQQFLYLQLQSTKLNYSNTEKSTMQLSISITNILLKYQNKPQLINSALLTRGPSEQLNQNLLLFQFKKQANDRKVLLYVTQIELNHQTRVLLLISQLLKLKAKQQMKSDVVLKKAQMASQGRDIQKQLGQNYTIDIKINKIVFKIQVNDQSHILISMDGVSVSTEDKQDHHFGILRNLNIIYVTNHKKSSQKAHINSILKDFTVSFKISSYFNKISTKMEKLEIFICEADLHNIYKSLLKQAHVFKAEKEEQKNKSIHENSYVIGHLRLLNIMKTWKQYQGVLTDQGLYFFQYQVFDEEEKSTFVNQKYAHMIPINNCIVTVINEQQFKLQSNNVKQLIYCSSEQLQLWVEYIQKIVFENSSRAKMYKLIDQQQQQNQKGLQKVIKYQKQIQFQFQIIQILICQVKNKNLMKISCKEMILMMKENQLKFQRNFRLQQIFIKKLDTGHQSQFNYIATNKNGLNDEHIKVQIKGKKKLHPEYRGQLQIKAQVPFFKINYDPQFIYKMIKKIAWRHQIPSYTNDMRNSKILQMIRQFLRSSVYEKRQTELKSPNCRTLHSYHEYAQINKYKNLGNTCVVLLSVKAEVKELQLNLINGINNVCIFNAKANDIKTTIDKGTQFIFFKLNAQKLELFDVTGYPNTNTKPNKISGYCPILTRKKEQQRQFKQGVQCCFSRFEVDRFINKDRYKTFFFLDIYDAQLNFQNQPFNRFFDYLFNQLIGFILAPNSLHKYDGPRRGPFLYENNIVFTQKEIKEIISDCIQPFFVKMFINAYNLRVKFNSFPNLEGINLDIETLKLQSFNYQKSQRIKFNHLQLNKYQKHQIFKQLMGVPGFQQKFLKNHWVSRMDILVEGIRSDIFASQVTKLSTYLERLLHSEKQLICPFVSLDTSLFIQSLAKSLSLTAPRQTYNLINKCMLHNLAYDDQQDSFFTHNYQFRSIMKVPELYYKLKASQFQMIIPEMKTLVAIPDFTYVFLRKPTLVKFMTVEGKTLNIFKNNQIIMMQNQSSDKIKIDSNGLIYKIQMKVSGQKIMGVQLNYIDIHYDLQFFLKFIQYTILDQSCYPPLPPGTIISQLPDLPQISCTAVLENCRIKLIVPKSDDDDQFICSGIISLLWVRNSLPHPQKYANNPQNYPNGRQWCNYRIQIKDMSIRKHYKTKQTADIKSSNYNVGIQKSRYRSISNKISIIFKISQIMKLANNQRDRYNDNIFDLKVFSIGMKLSYVDIDHLKKVFVKENQENKMQENIMNEENQGSIAQFRRSQRKSQIRNSMLNRKSIRNSVRNSLPAAPAFTPYTKYTIDINRIQVQLGLSQLPVPLIDFIVKSTKCTTEFIGQNKTGSLKSSVTANCWNMLIGRWQPIIEELSVSMNFKIGQDKYLLLDCSQKLLFNVSLQSLKILKLISSDFSQKGNFSISKIFNQQNQQNSDSIKVKGINISPYVFTNRTGIPIIVYDQSNSTKIKLKPQQKVYIELKNLEIDSVQKTKVIFELEQNSEKIQVNMDLASRKKIQVIYKGKMYELLLKPISSSIMKQIILCSPFVIQNKTKYGIVFFYNYQSSQDQNSTYEGKIKVMPKEKTALKFTANIKNINLKTLSHKNQKNLKIEFPQLQKSQIQNNCQFPYEALQNDYQHQIDMLKNRAFNCVISLRQNNVENQIFVEPSFYVKNLLPINLMIQFVVQRNNQKIIFTNELQVNEEKDLYDFNSRQNLQMRIKIKGFNISPFQSILTSTKSQQQMITYLNLIDYRGQSARIGVKIMKNNRVRKMYIFAQGVLINETKYDWYAFNSSKLIPGQKINQVIESETIYTFINASQYQTLNFGFEEDNPFNSNQIKITELGVNDVTMYKNSSLFQFTIKCNFYCLDNNALLYSYVLKAQPKYIFVNDTTHTLQITQFNTQNNSKLVKPTQRLNWIWPVRTQQKKIILRVKNQIQTQLSQWFFSSPIMITSDDIEENVLVLRPKSNKNLSKKLLKITPIKQNQSVYFLIQEVNKIEDYLITINNELESCKIRAYQEHINEKNPSWAENKYFQVAPKTNIPFGWDYPNQPQVIMAQISFLGYLRNKFDSQIIQINIQSPKVDQIVISNQNQQTHQITVKVQIIGLRKKITFCQRQDFQQQDPQQEMMMQTSSRYAFSFTELGISLISSVKKRSQLLFINLKKVEIIMMQRKSSRSLQVKIKYINIDNNYNHNTIYPILFTPLKHNKTINKSRPFFVLLLEQTLQSKDIIEIKEFRVCNQPISIKIHDQILTAVFQMIQQINKQTDKSQDKIDLIAIYRSHFNQTQWLQTKLIKPQRDIFFRQFQIAKLALQITFSLRPKLNTNNFIIVTILSSFGVAISNVSEAQLTLSRFLKRDKGLSQLKSQIYNFYFKQFVKGIYKVLGSINLFGNPYVFIRMISEGAWEIVNQPTEGFIKGPIEGAIGIVKGGVFFTRNVVAGTCNSFQAISQSISRGVSYLTMDQKFIERRQKIKIQKSNHFFKGLQYGAFSIYTGVQVALTGLVRHPAQGYSQNGFLGGFTGTLKGISGLITKPISGTFEGISKISEGIKNTALLFQDGPNSKRMRPPRIFISELSYYKNYNVYQSTAISILEFASTKYLNEQINYICITEHNGNIDAYVMTERFLSHVDIINDKIIQEVSIGDIREVKKENNRLKLTTNRDALIIDEQNTQQIFEAYQKYYGNK